MVPSAAHPPQQRTGADGGLAPDGLCSAASVSASEFKGKPGETTAPPACVPNDGLKEDEQGLDEHGGVHDVQGLDVLLVPVGEQGLRRGPGPAGFFTGTFSLACKVSAIAAPSHRLGNGGSETLSNTEVHGASRQRNWNLRPGFLNCRLLALTQVGGTCLPPTWNTLLSEQNAARPPAPRPQPTCGQTPGRHPGAS